MFHLNNGNFFHIQHIFCIYDTKLSNKSDIFNQLSLNRGNFLYACSSKEQFSLIYPNIKCNKGNIWYWSTSVNGIRQDFFNFKHIRNRKVMTWQDMMKGIFSTEHYSFVVFMSFPGIVVPEFIPASTDRQTYNDIQG